LIKRHVISRYCPGVAWDAATAVPDARTKPVFLMPDGSEPLLFNVSHQAGLVVLLAVHAPPPGLAIGVDVVCQGERRQRDIATITKDGWPRYVDMHDEVLSPAEVRWLKSQLPSADADTRLGYFYAAWGLHEAYVKMTGEALLAPWLKDLEMRNFTPPSQAEGAGALEVYFKGQKVEDVDARLDPLLDEYMVATVVKRGKDGQTVDIGEYALLDVEDVLGSAENSRQAAGSSA
jgi:4'-phosphopantetheinyl transferase